MKIIILTLVCFILTLARAMADTQSVGQGKALYRSYGCALCHGWEGKGDGINAQKFDPPPTNLHNPLAYQHGADRDSIRRSIQYGIKEDSSIMPAFEHISPEEMQKLIDYLQSLQTNKE